MEKGLIIASFGTTYRETRIKTISNIEKNIQRAFKERENLYSLRAFTSRIIKKRLMEKEGFYVFDASEAKTHLLDRGIDSNEIYVQPLHLLPGVEYEKLEKMEGIKLGEPLFSSKKDLSEFIENVSFDLKEDEALILFGHGTYHKNDQIYFDLQELYEQKGFKNIFIVCVEGSLGLKYSLDKILDLAPKKVILQPLMIVAGDHAKNDMASLEDGSLRHELEKHNLNVEANLIGLGELDSVVDLFIKKTEKLLNNKINTKEEKFGYLTKE